MVANDLTITVSDLRHHMQWYVGLVFVSGGVPVFTTNRDIIEGRTKVTVVADEEDPRWQ